MASRTLFSCLVALCAATACKTKGDAPAGAAGPADLDKRCQQLAKVCADQGKHVDKMLAECTQAAATQVAKGCTEQAIATYDCYVKDICSGGEKMWSIADVRVLAERHGKCVAEQAATRACVEK